MSSVHQVSFTFGATLGPYKCRFTVVPLTAKVRVVMMFPCIGEKFFLFG